MMEVKRKQKARYSGSEECSGCRGSKVMAATAFLIALCSIAMSSYLLYMYRDLAQTVSQLSTRESVNDKSHVQISKHELVEHVVNKLREKRSISSTGYAHYVRWGLTSCTEGRFQSGLPAGIIVALHDSQSEKIIPGAEMICLPVSNHINGTGPSYVGSTLKLAPVKFDLTSLQKVTTPGANRGHLPCTFCQLKAFDVMTVVGKLTCPSDWNMVYDGYYMTSSRKDDNCCGGTSSSICVETGGRPLMSFRSAHQFAKPVVSGGTSNIFPSFNKLIPCVVCANRFNPSSFVGATGARGATGDDGRDGQNGRNGQDGSNGSPGFAGAAGAQGADGRNGRDGDVGATGARGMTGNMGAKGARGAKGAQGEVGATGPHSFRGAGFWARGRDGRDGRDRAA